jgi:hypothetical protein
MRFGLFCVGSGPAKICKLAFCCNSKPLYLGVSATICVRYFEIEIKKKFKPIMDILVYQAGLVCC